MGRQELVGKIKAEGRQTKKELKVTPPSYQGLLLKLKWDFKVTNLTTVVCHRPEKVFLQAQVKSASFWYVALNTGALIAFYYLTSIGLTFYQSWLMKELQFPLTIVLSHFIMKFCLAAGCRTAYTLHTGQTRPTTCFSKAFQGMGY